MIGLKKIIKKNIIKESIFGVPPTLVGAIFLYGRIGSGKTTAMLTLSQKYHDHPERRYKIFDFWGGERSEQLYWTLPSTDFEYWSKIKKKLLLSDDGPRQYKVNLLFPMSRRLPDKLPSYPPYIHSKVFTIPFKDITIDDISLVLGVVSNENKFLWKEVIEHSKKSDNGENIKYLMKELRGTARPLYKSFILPFTRDHILQNTNNDYNLDLLEELKDRDVISILVLDYVDKEYYLFYLGYILRQVSKLLDSGKTRNRIVGLIREATDFFRATDQSTMEDKYKIFRTQLSQHIRMGRRGLHLFLDAQSPNETRGLVDGSQDLTILARLPSQDDRLQATAQLYRDNLISKKQIIDLGQLNPGEYYISESGKKVRKRYFFLPRTMYWKPGFGNFYLSVWKNYRNSFMNIKNIKEKIINDSLETRKKLEVYEKLSRVLDMKNKKKRGVIAPVTQEITPVSSQVTPVNENNGIEVELW